MGMSKRCFLYLRTLSQVIINLFVPRANIINSIVNCIIKIYLYCDSIPIIVKINLITFICHEFICCIFGIYTNVLNAAKIHTYISNKFGIELTDGNLTIASGKSVQMRQDIKYRYGWVLSKDNGAIISQTIVANNGESQSLRDGTMYINHQTGTTDTKTIYTTTDNDDERMFLIFGGLSYNSDNYLFQAIFHIVFKNSQITQNFVYLAMKGMRVHNADINKIYVLF